MKSVYHRFILPAFFLIYSLSGISQTYTDTSFVITTAQTGTKAYIARESITLKPGFSYTASSINTFSAKIDPTLLFPPTGNTYAKPNGTITTDPTLGAVVGSIPGQFDVSPTGAATYSVPIECPPGIQGMQPNVSLVYNSQSGNGIAGWGWNIGGISSINRTGSTIYHDGKVATVELTNSDNFVLDGQRLILVSGTHFTNGAKYRTEIETYSDITYKTINGYLCFEVVTKEGMKLEYGSSTDSYINAQGTTSTPLVWFLKKVTDTNNNYMTYEYGQNNAAGEYWLSRIAYTGNGTVPVSPVNEIVFGYEGRSDSITYYIAGKQVMQTKRLASISSKTDNQIYRKYTCQYVDGLYSQMMWLKEETAEGIAYPKTIIEWKNPDDAYSKYESEINSPSPSFKLNDRPIFADFNGDGKRDFITFIDDKVTLYLNDGNEARNFLKQYEFNVYGGECKGVIVADLNGDGSMDLIAITPAPNGSYRYNYYFFTEGVFTNGGGSGYKGFNTAVKDNDYIIGDFNGDGKHEILIKSTKILYDENGNATQTTGISNWGNEYMPTFPNNINLLDFTGNGKTNICIRTGSNGTVYELTGSTFTPILSTDQLNNTHDIYTGDYNGDGKSDLFVLKTNQ